MPRNAIVVVKRKRPPYKAWYRAEQRRHQETRDELTRLRRERDRLRAVLAELAPAVFDRIEASVDDTVTVSPLEWEAVYAALVRANQVVGGVADPAHVVLSWKGRRLLRAPAEDHADD